MERVTAVSYTHLEENSLAPLKAHSFHTHKSPHPPSGSVGDVVAMFQIESPGIGNHGVAEAAGFQRCTGIFFAPHPVSYTHLDVYKRQGLNRRTA